MEAREWAMDIRGEGMGNGGEGITYF